MAVANRGNTLAGWLLWPELNHYPGKEKSKSQGQIEDICMSTQLHLDGREVG